MTTGPFDHIPDLGEILGTNGLPGVAYLLTTPERANHLIQTSASLDPNLRWHPIKDLSLFTVKDQTAFLVGRGEPIRGVPPASCHPIYIIDRKFDGVPPLPKPTTLPPTPTPKQGQGQGSGSDRGGVSRGAGNEAPSTASRT
jgi:hypothetical protein